MKIFKITQRSCLNGKQINCENVKVSTDRTVTASSYVVNN